MRRDSSWEVYAWVMKDGRYGGRDPGKEKDWVFLEAREGERGGGG